MFIDNGEEFIIVDDWKVRSTAHRKLERPWRGTTTFESDYVGSVRIRSPGTDKADGPADVQDEDRSSGRVEPKPTHAVVRVKK